MTKSLVSFKRLIMNKWSVALGVSCGQTIKELKNPNPIVNCATCHRGQLKPALDVKAGN